MNFRTAFLSILLLSGYGYVHAQHSGQGAGPPSPPIPLEVFAGNEYLNFQMIISKPFAPGSRFSFFNVTSFNGDYQNDEGENEYITQGLLNYEVFKGLSVATGATMHYRTGFRPTAGLNYVFGSRKWLFVLLPRFDLSDDYNFETFSLLEFKPPITKDIGLYTRIQGLYNHNTEQDFHDRSYLYFRVGLSYRKYQAGLGANFDRYGPGEIDTENYGLFIRAQIAN
ncbi:MAG: hypothetical protein WBA23_21630 [Tunicatimonas sp.]|uniref:hypothetical protein n=1 Tax=Tunicatimonas sp. TaxID=1940096 RepID=UPI003C736A4C